MDCATRPNRLDNDADWIAYKRQYQREWRSKPENMARKKLISLGELPKRRRTHVKRRPT
jgi:hypothetical protein